MPPEVFHAYPLQPPIQVGFTDEGLTVTFPGESQANNTISFPAESRELFPPAQLGDPPAHVEFPSDVRPLFDLFQRFIIVFEDPGVISFPAAGRRTIRIQGKKFTIAAPHHAR